MINGDVTQKRSEGGGGGGHLRAKAMMELGSLSHTAMGTRSCSYIR